MADNENHTVIDATKAPEAEMPAEPKKNATRGKKPGKAPAALSVPSKIKVRGLSATDKHKMIEQIDAQVANGVTLKDAV
ncbi:hypothetical protein N5K21_10520 [Rhizobium pusense]|uniref:hypothetical protein n=1 Tax=Agrobacterium pusense TaxID=648995 RepID=UPI0010AEA796|nr:hypothetical protein [Agrobacterium pusense]MDH2089152.1 hypothetical protein [Agrobacterium pusense]WCK27305.1 hypothetical protein CFBP5496_0024255 [Agrobacterium pusense]